MFGMFKKHTIENLDYNELSKVTWEDLQYGKRRTAEIQFLTRHRAYKLERIEILGNKLHALEDHVTQLTAELEMYKAFVGKVTNSKD